MVITKKELKELYDNNSNSIVCEKLGITTPTLMRYLKASKISLKGKGGGMAKNGADKKIKVIK